MRSATSITSLSLWVMKMIDLPLLDQRLQDLEQPFDLLRRQHRRRLVQDQDVRGPVEHLDDFNSLLYPH